jgi:signal peptidase I
LAKEKNKQETPAQPPKKKETLPEFFASMASVLVIGLFIITFNLQAFEIPSASMENTLLIGDHVFVDRITLAPRSNWASPVVHYRDVKRGDVIVFLSPNPSEQGLHIVKRVIGIPGDHIRLHNGRPYVNEQPPNEPYAIYDGSYRDYRDNFPAVPPDPAYGVTEEFAERLPKLIENGEFVVPKGEYFCMGDNRDNSLDSRYWGPVPLQNIIGRPLFIYWSFQTPADQVYKNSLGDRIGFLFHVVIHFFDQTRWRRMGHLVR